MPLRPSPLVHALLLATSLGLASPGLHAAEARTYHIAAGSLEDALNQFGRESGALISFGSQLTQGLNSQGLDGQYDVTEGLDALLRGSGLQARQEAENAFSLQSVDAAQPGAAVELGASTVVGDWLGEAQQDHVFEHAGARDVVRRE